MTRISRRTLSYGQRAKSHSRADPCVSRPLAATPSRCTLKEDGVMAEYRLISADSHFVEPPTMWAERLDQKFRDRAPHTVKGLNGREGEWFVCENITPMAVAGFFGAGVPSQELPEHNKKGFEQAPKSVWDPAARIADQDRDGVEAEVIYTSMGMPLFGLDDAEFRHACFRAFNDWATEYCQLDCCVLADNRRLLIAPCPAVAWQTKRQRDLPPFARVGVARGHTGSTLARVPALAGDTLPRWF